MPHPHQPYPALDLACASELWRLVRERAIRTEFPLFAKCVYSLLGTALGQFVGEPDGVEVLFGGGDADDSTLAALQTELESLHADGPPAEVFGAEGDQEALNPAVIAIIMQVLPLIIELIKKRRNK